MLTAQPTDVADGAPIRVPMHESRGAIHLRVVGDETMGYTVLAGPVAVSTNVMATNTPSAAGGSTLTVSETKTILDWVQTWGDLITVVKMYPRGRFRGVDAAAGSAGFDVHLPDNTRLAAVISYAGSVHGKSDTSGTLVLSRSITGKLTWTLEVSDSFWRRAGGPRLVVGFDWRF